MTAECQPRRDGGVLCTDWLHGPISFVVGNPFLCMFDGICPGKTPDLDILSASGIPSFHSQKSMRDELAINGRPASEFAILPNGGGFGGGFGLPPDAPKSGSGDGYFCFVFHLMRLGCGLFFGKSCGPASGGCVQPLLLRHFIAGQSGLRANLSPQSPHDASGGMLSAGPVASVGAAGDFRVRIFTVQFFE